MATIKAGQRKSNIHEIGEHVEEKIVKTLIQGKFPEI